MPAKKTPAVRKTTTRSVRAAPARKTGVRRARAPVSYRRQIEALEGGERKVTLEFQEGAVTLTNLEKVLWPASPKLPAYTRRDHMRYLLRVADYMLRHVEHRPLTLIRQPEGVTG